MSRATILLSWEQFDFQLKLGFVCPVWLSLLVSSWHKHFLQSKLEHASNVCAAMSIYVISMVASTHLSDKPYLYSPCCRNGQLIVHILLQFLRQTDMVQGLQYNCTGVLVKLYFEHDVQYNCTVVLLWSRCFAIFVWGDDMVCPEEIMTIFRQRMCSIRYDKLTKNSTDLSYEVTLVQERYIACTRGYQWFLAAVARVYFRARQSCCPCE